MYARIFKCIFLAFAYLFRIFAFMFGKCLMGYEYFIYSIDMCLDFSICMIAIL